ncbi:protein disulfide-isomerase 1-like [Mercenaria mercenaria]|uniref:protein disulfide-isomerase 1-like n=1 Tax=Mercenaria mercenaria TaxID=6596 RepID=UPI00234F4686|nr:protein disulfide-isomerase 1-like [Mercenaria mercenaria]
MRLCVKFLLPVIISWSMLVFSSGVEIVELTESNFETNIKRMKCMFLYATEDNCEKCKLLFHKFLITAQTFERERDITFGKVSDKTLINAFEVTSFPGIVYYEYGSAVPKVYLGDITPTALAKVVSDAMKIDFKKVDRHFALQLTKDNFDEIMDTDKQYRLVMLHEADDEDEVDLYEEIAETYENEPDVVIARINIDSERKLRKQYSSYTYPSFYWYRKGDAKKKKRYGGDLNVNQMISFINKEGGFFRTKGGRLNPYAGLVKPLDEVINKYGKDLYEIRNIDQIKQELEKEIAKLPADQDKELTKYYLHLIDEIEEDRTIETLDESRNRLFRQMSGAGPLEFDQLVRKKNVIQKIIDIIGLHLLEQISDGNIDVPLDADVSYGFEEHGLEFHEEL